MCFDFGSPNVVSKHVGLKYQGKYVKAADESLDEQESYGGHEATK